MDNPQNRQLAKEAMQAKFVELNNDFVEFQDWLLDIFFSMPEQNVKATFVEYISKKKVALASAKSELQDQSSTQVGEIESQITQLDDMLADLV